MSLKYKNLQVPSYLAFYKTSKWNRKGINTEKYINCNHITDTEGIEWFLSD